MKKRDKDQHRNGGGFMRDSMGLGAATGRRRSSGEEREGIPASLNNNNTSSSSSSFPTPSTYRHGGGVGGFSGLMSSSNSRPSFVTSSTSCTVVAAALKASGNKNLMEKAGRIGGRAAAALARATATWGGGFIGIGSARMQQKSIGHNSQVACSWEATATARRRRMGWKTKSGTTTTTEKG